MSRAHGRMAGMALASWALLAAPVQATEFSRGGAFLPLGHGARSHALGNAAVCFMRDDGAVYWNPANLAWLQQTTGITFMHADLLEGVGDGYDTLSFGRVAGARLGLTQQSLRPSRWGYGFFLARMGVEFPSGKRWSENTITFAAALALNNFTSLGIGLKGLVASNDFDAANGRGAGFDLALTILVLEPLTLAVVGRDVWTRVRWDTSTWETLEPSLTFGVELRPAKAWTSEVDFIFRQRTLQAMGVGVEWQVFRDLFWLRGGAYVLRPGDSRVAPSAGAGVHYSRLGVDYGVRVDEEDAQGIGHRVAVRLLF